MGKMTRRARREHLELSITSLIVLGLIWWIVEGAAKWISQ